MTTTSPANRTELFYGSHVAASEQQPTGRSDARPTQVRRSSTRHLRRLAHSYLGLVSSACTMGCGYGLAAVLGLAPLTSLLLMLDLIWEHLAIALATTALVAILAAAALAWDDDERRKQDTWGKRLARRAGRVVRSAAGSTLAALALQLPLGLEFLPIASPLAHLAGWLAARLALSGVYRLLLLGCEAAARLLHRVHRHRPRA